MLHKGTCDKAYKNGRSDAGGWSELSHFLFRLCVNAGLNSKAFNEAGESVTRVDSYF